MENILKTNSLVKTYKHINVVNNINITINKGDIYGLIGRNGAGKTTIMRMIVGLAEPTSGSMTLFESNNLNANRKKIGCVIENPALLSNLSAYDNLLFYNKILGIKDNSNIRELLTIMRLNPDDKKKAKHFSLGMKQRLAIAISLISSPEFLVLDEPINGLDPTGIKEIRDCLIKLNQEKGTTILISSHILGELDKIATKYGVIDKGTMIKEFTKDELSEIGEKYLKINVDDVSKAEKIIKESFNTTNYKISENTILLYDHIDDSAAINKALAIGDVSVQSISVIEQDLEGYFMELMGGTANA